MFLNRTTWLLPPIGRFCAALLLLVLGAVESGAVERLIQRGDSDELVLAIQGQPTRRERLTNYGQEAWYYGESSIRFDSDTMLVDTWLDIDGNLLVVPEGGLPLPTPGPGTQPGPSPTSVPDSGLSPENLLRGETLPGQAFDPGRPPQLDRPAPPAAPGLGREGVGPAFPESAERRRYQSGLGALPEPGELGPGDAVQRRLIEQEREVYREEARRHGDLTFQRSVGAEGESVSGMRLDTGGGTSVEIYSDNEGRSAVSRQTHYGDAWHQQYHTAGGQSAQRRGVDIGNRSIEHFERSDGLSVRRESADYGSTRIENYDASLPEGGGESVRAQTQELGDGQFRRFETVRRDAEGVETRETFQGLSRDNGSDSTTHHYIDPGTGRQLGGFEQRSGDHSFESYQTPEGKTVTRSSYRVGHRVYTNYIDEKGQLRQEITILEPDDED